VYSLATPPFFSRLESSASVLLAGAGGGFDVYAGLPLALALNAAGKKVHLASVSFAGLGALSLDDWLGPELAMITAATQEGSYSYFPERTLARWLAGQGLDWPVYAFPQTGVQPLRAAYRTLIERCGADAVVLVDGGTDIWMRGDESGLGTPEEDVTSLASVAALDDVPVRLVASLGFGIDAFHGVNHAQVLENLAALEADGSYLGAFSLPPDSAEGRMYLDAVADAAEATPTRPSIVHGQIAAAMHGAFGDVPLSERTRGSSLFVNPLMHIYFAADLPGLARKNLYLDLIEDTHTIRQVALAIEKYRYELPKTRPPRAIPH
jgi:hypothetical protein